MDGVVLVVVMAVVVEEGGWTQGCECCVVEDAMDGVVVAVMVVDLVVVW